MDMPKTKKPYEKYIKTNSTLTGLLNGIDEQGNLVLNPYINTHYDVNLGKDVRFVKKDALASLVSIGTFRETTFQQMIQYVGFLNKQESEKKS